MTTAPAVATRDLRKSYGKHEAVRGLDLRVATGSIFGLIGPNGAGKTTTLRMLLDIIRPTAGSIEVLGANPTTAGADLRRRIGYIPGELRLVGKMTGKQTLDFYAEVSGPVAPGRPEELAERLGLDLTRRVGTLSKGNKQKVGIVQAFMHAPELLILDEPTSGLDPLVQREFLALVREAREAGATVLLSSHVLSEIQQAADDVAVLAAGTVVAEGDVSSLRLGAVRRVRATLAAPAEEATALLGGVPHLSEVEVRPDGAAPDSATPTSQELTSLTLTVQGEIDPLVKALAATSVRDLAIEEPDLEESVLALYGPGATSTGATSTSSTTPGKETDR